MKIVLCGSKKFIPKIFEVSEKLQKMGFETVIPREFIYEMTKKEASIRHFSEIEKEDVSALLIVNETKNGVHNYIGANSFAELAFGFYKRKTVYLLNDIYEPYSEELVAWEVIPLHGDLSKIKKFRNISKNML